MRKLILSLVAIASVVTLAACSDATFYKVIFKPSVIIPNIEVR